MDEPLWSVYFYCKVKEILRWIDVLFPRFIHTFGGNQLGIDRNEYRSIGVALFIERYVETYEIEV